jgi:hypothetical protein
MLWTSCVGVFVPMLTKQACVPAGQKVWLQLEEKRIPYTIEKINMRCYGDKPPSFLAKVGTCGTGVGTLAVVGGACDGLAALLRLHCGHITTTSASCVGNAHTGIRALLGSRGQRLVEMSRAAPGQHASQEGRLPGIAFYPSGVPAIDWRATRCDIDSSACLAACRCLLACYLCWSWTDGW